MASGHHLRPGIPLDAIWNADEQLRGLRIHPFRYPSPKKPLLPLSRKRVPAYDDLAQTLATEYRVGLAEASNVAIVTHSQGGLILQRFLAWMWTRAAVGSWPDPLDRNAGLPRCRVGISSIHPHGPLVGHHPQAGSLKVLDRQVADTQRTVLQRIVNATGVDDHECRIPFHVYAGASDKIVTAASAQGAFPGAAALAGNHFSILDPVAPNRTAETVKHHLITDLSANDRVRVVLEPPGEATVNAHGAVLRAPTGRLPEHVRGHGDLLIRLRDLAEAPDGLVHVLVGLGGTGKSTIALQVAEEMSLLGRPVWWVSAVDTETVAAKPEPGPRAWGAARCVIEAQNGRRDAADLLWRFLEARPGWLLIFDNAGGLLGRTYSQRQRCKRRRGLDPPVSLGTDSSH